MPTKVNIRPYLDLDRSQLIVCMANLARTLAKLNPLRRPEPAAVYGESYLQKMLNHTTNGNGVILVAEFDTEIIGYVVGYVRTQSPEELLEYKPAKIGYIPDLYSSRKTDWRMLLG